MFDAVPVELTDPFVKFEEVPSISTPDPIWMGSPFPDVPCICEKISPKLSVWSLNPSVLRFAKLLPITSSSEELACRPESGTEQDAIYLPPESVKFKIGVRPIR